MLVALLELEELLAFYCLCLCSGMMCENQDSAFEVGARKLTVQRRTLLRKHKRGDPRFINTPLSSLCIAKSNCMLIVDGCTMAMEKCGVTGDIYDNFPYSDLIKIRKNRYGGRILPGEVILCKSPFHPHHDDGYQPMIATMYTKFGLGDVLSKNIKMQQDILRMTYPDCVLLAGLKNETEESRLEAFKKCLLELENIIIEKHVFDNIDKIYLPWGLGLCGSEITENYMKSFYPEIEAFCKTIAEMDKTVYVCYNQARDVPEVLHKYIM